MTGKQVGVSQTGLQTISSVSFTGMLDGVSPKPANDIEVILDLTADQALIASRLTICGPSMSSVHDSQIRQIMIKMMVIGIVVAMKSHQSVVTTTSPFWLSKNTMPKKPETAVAGRNIMVKAAMIFIAELSALVARAIEVFVSLSCWVTKLKTCIMLVAS